MKNMDLMNTRKPNYVFRQRGASLLEGIAYLGIAAIVILGAVSLLVSGFTSAQTNRTNEELTGLRTATQKVFMNQGGYGTGNITDTLIAARAQPTSLTIGGNAPNRTLTNAWNGGVTVTGVNAQFTVQYTGVPEEVCVNLLMGTNGWVSVVTGANNVRNAFPITPAQADADCAAGANTITWTGN
ncbi:MAG TPA: type 4 pilus major pilin [Noviherbaspirillum sp.]|nr:type 4 pilus major pilin [Noviherbaspirillum sp.]